MQLHQDFLPNFPRGQPNPYMPPDQFEAYVAWAGDKFYYSGADLVNEVGSSTVVDEEFNIELDEFLGREDLVKICFFLQLFYFLFLVI